MSGDVTLVAIATSEGQVFVFDVKANKKLVMEGGIWRIIESNHLLKVCTSDLLEKFWYSKSVFL